MKGARILFCLLVVCSCKSKEAGTPVVEAPAKIEGAAGPAAEAGESKPASGAVGAGGEAPVDGPSAKTKLADPKATSVPRDEVVSDKAQPTGESAVDQAEQPGAEDKSIAAPDSTASSAPKAPQEGKRKGRWDDYKLDVFDEYKLPIRPVSRFDGVSVDALRDWTEVPLEDDYMGLRQYRDAWDAALDTPGVPSAGSLAFEMIAAGEWEAFTRTYATPQWEYMELMSCSGYKWVAAAAEEYPVRIKAQYESAYDRFGEFSSTVKREDRLYGIWRLSKWHFEYITRDGGKQKGCFLFMLADARWTVVDLECKWPL